jgi:predicted phosphohydrolase
MAHFPPCLAGRPPGKVLDLLVEAGVKICVYGHLHGEDHALALDGRHHGIDFRFVAVDAIGFRPRRIELPREEP